MELVPTWASLDSAHDKLPIIEHTTRTYHKSDGSSYHGPLSRGKFKEALILRFGCLQALEEAIKTEAKEFIIWR